MEINAGFPKEVFASKIEIATVNKDHNPFILAHQNPQNITGD